MVWGRSNEDKVKHNGFRLKYIECVKITKVLSLDEKEFFEVCLNVRERLALCILSFESFTQNVRMSLSGVYVYLNISFVTSFVLMVVFCQLTLSWTSSLGLRHI